MQAFCCRTAGGKSLIVTDYRTVLKPNALLRGLSLNQRSIHLEVFVRHEIVGLFVHFGEEPLSDFGVQ